MTSSDTTTSASMPLRAFRWMLGALVSFSGMVIAGRELAAELDTFEIMAYRSLVGLPIIGLLVWRLGGVAKVRTQQPLRHLLRNVIHFIAQNAWFYGVATISLAQLTAIEFTNPIWVLLFAPLCLGERMTKTRIIAGGLGFLGVLVVVQPGVSTLGPGHAAALVAAVGFALTNITTRRLARDDGLLCILFRMTLTQAVLGLLTAAPGGMALFSWAMTPWVLFVGVCGITAHFCLTRALAIAPAIMVAPMEFMRLPLLAVAGMLFYGEPLEIAVLIGGLIILAGNLVNLSSRDTR